MYLTYQDGQQEEGYIRTVGHLYLPYITYKGLGGTLDEITFSRFEYEAETIVNWYTFNRLKGEEKYPDELEYCMFSLIEYAKLQADAILLGKHTVTVTDDEGHSTSVETTAYIKSQSNDRVSISYNNVDASDLFKRLTSTGKDNPMAQIVFRYLQGVRNSKGYRLTYRGMYPDE